MSPPPPPPPPPVFARLTLDKDIATIPAGSPARTAFEAAFKTDIGEVLSVDTSRVTVLSIAAGSLVVEFSITWPALAAGVQSALSVPGLSVAGAPALSAEAEDGALPPPSAPPSAPPPAPVIPPPSAPSVPPAAVDDDILGVDRTVMLVLIAIGIAIAIVVALVLVKTFVLAKPARPDGTNEQEEENALHPDATRQQTAYQEDLTPGTSFSNAFSSAGKRAPPPLAGGFTQAGSQSGSLAASQATGALRQAAADGEWQQHEDPTTRRPYWHNMRTGETTWTQPEQPAASSNPPPLLQAARNPPPLAAMQPRQATASSSESVSEWQQHEDPTTRRPYWHNPRTHETTWTQPGAQQQQQQAAPGGGRNPLPLGAAKPARRAPPALESTVRRRPAPVLPAQQSDWQQHVDATSGKPYYNNQKTGESSWTAQS